MKEVVLITGCSDGGIGNALALVFAAAGFKVVATDLSVEWMKSLEQHPDVELLQLDVTAEQAVIEETVEAVVAKFGYIDVLINNAGTQCIGPLAEVPHDMLERCYKTNVFGPLSLIRAVVPHMAARRKGKIVNIGSISAFCPAPWAGVYASTKAAIHSLTETLRLELKPFDIQVILVAPGAIISNIGKQAIRSKQNLPGLKLYQPYDPVIEKRAVGSQSPKSTPSAELARKILEAVQKTNSPRTLVFGHLSTLFYVLYYAPSWLREYFFEEMFGLHDKKTLQEVKKAV